jgi:uncharacterized membrane protein YfcA
VSFSVAVGLTAVAAGAVAAVSGFGIGSLLTPLLMLAMPAQHAVAVVAVPHALATTIRWLRLRRAIHLPTFRQFGIASAAGGLAGAALQSRLGSPVLTLALGCLLLLAGAGELFRRRLPLPQTPLWRLVGGMASGVFGGLVGNQGGIRAAALAGFHLAPRELVATATASALLVDLARIPVYLVSAPGAIAAAAPLWLVASAGVTLGTLVGVPVLARIPADAYGRLLGGLLVLLGVSLLVAVGSP